MEFGYRNRRLYSKDLGSYPENEKKFSPKDSYPLQISLLAVNRTSCTYPSHASYKPCASLNLPP